MREPNFNNILKVLNKEKPDRPTLFEFFLNFELYEKLAGCKFPPSTTPIDMNRLKIKAFATAGYDYATVHSSGFHFPNDKVSKANSESSAQTMSINDNFVIFDKKSFDEYKWLEPDDFDYSNMGQIEKDLPGNMKVMVDGPMGLLENAIRLVGYENLCFMIYEDEQLVYDIFDNIGKRLYRHYEKSLEYSSVGIIMSNDDWGFNTQTMLSVEQMRKFVFPWHKRFVELAHEKGRPIVLHSCGNFNEIMDEVIDDIKYDGKHSYEDNILSVEKSYDRWGGRIAILGGIDLDFIVNKTSEEIKKRCRDMLVKGERGYALGTGNSVPTYVPDDNYFAMTSTVFE